MISKNIYQAIVAMDLEPIKFKLMHQSGEGWSQARADAIATEYRRFLYLQHMHQGDMSSPTADVDTFWHYHILDTMKYAADCEQAFGYFMHHYPYVGMHEGEEGDEIIAGERTRVLYEATFGEEYIRAEAYGVDGYGVDATPAQTGSQAARCQQMCGLGQAGTQAQPAAKPARCQQMCGLGQARTQARPAAKTARCQQMCGIASASDAARRAASPARCQQMCGVGKPPTGSQAAQGGQAHC